MNLPRSLAVPAALIALTGCATGAAEPAPSETGSASAMSTPSRTPTPSTSTTPTTSATPTPHAPAGTIPLGAIGHYTAGASPWDITLTKIQCGLASVPGARLNPRWNGSNSQPQYVAAHPAKGSELCQVLWRWTNRGSSAVTVGMGADLQVGDQTITRSEDELAWSIATTKTQLGVDMMDPVPAGGSVQRIDVYQIPAGQKPVAVWCPTGASPLAFATTKH